MEELDIIHLTKRSIQSILALISRQFILQLISLGAFLVISTHLSAAELGIYTGVIAIQRIISFFTDFGLGAALVQKKEELEKDDIITTFTLQLIITLSILVLILLSHGIIGQFFRLNDAAQWLLVALVFTLFLSSFKIIPSILLERRINFQKLVIPQIVESLTFNILLVILILKGSGISSYTYAFLVSGVISIPIYYMVSPWPIGIGISKKALSHLKYGSQFQAKNILATIKDDLLTVILIKFLSFTQIGYIGFAQKLAFFVFRYVVDSVTKVTFSTYSRMQENLEHLGKAIEKSLFFVSTTMFPVLAGIALTSPYFVEYIPKWHSKWEPALISLVFFCLNAGVSSLSAILVNVLDATGRVKTTLRLMMLWTSLTWVLTPLLIYFWGYNGVAIASFLVTLTIVYTTYLVKKIVRFSFFPQISKAFFATIVMAGFVFIFTKLFVSDLLTLFFVILMGGGVYLFALYLLAGKQIILDIKSVIIKRK